MYNYTGGTEQIRACVVRANMIDQPELPINDEARNAAHIASAVCGCIGAHPGLLATSTNERGNW